MASLSISPIASDSDISIVVWLARPMRSQVAIGVETRRGRAREPRQESRRGRRRAGCSRRRSAVSVVVEDDEIAAAVRDGLRRGRLRLLVPDLAVDDRGVAALGVAPDVLPDVQHRSAGRVDERAAAAIELLQHRDRDAEGRQDHDVGRAELDADVTPPGRR